MGVLVYNVGASSNLVFTSELFIFLFFLVIGHFFDLPTLANNLATIFGLIF